MMEMHLFSSLEMTLMALLGGFLFGFLLRKGAVSRFDTIVGQLLLKDFTVMKVMMTAIVFGSIGLFTLHAYGWIPAFDLSKTAVLYVFIGAVIFGCGMSIAGYCPGTGIAAIAEGSEDMIFGLGGMLVASALFNTFSHTLMPHMKQHDMTYNQTLSTFFGVSHWTVILGLLGLWVLFILVVRKVEKRAAY